jgi:HSP20 family molecular chaperone IbpA
LLGIIGYQGYLLSQKDTTDGDTVIEKKIVKKDAPEININIDKTPSPKTARNSSTSAPSVSNLTDEERRELDQKNIEKSIQDVFKSIFASKEVQDGLTQFKAQAQQGIQELQKELEELPSKIESMQSELKDDPFFSQILGQLKGFGGKQLEDKGDYYYLKTDVPGGKESKVDIQTKGHFLTIMIDSKDKKTTKSANGTMMQSSSQSSTSSLLLPSDAFVEKLQTNYENGILEITIPKITAKTSL